MLKKSLIIALLSIVIIQVFFVPIAAAPYKEIRIGEGETVIEAVWFDSGEENYFEMDGGGNHDIRPDETMATYDYKINGDYVGGRETDTPSCVGWTTSDEWVQYTIQTDIAGKYQVSAWLASEGASGDIVVYYDDAEIGSVYCDPVGWHKYTLFSIGTVDMTEGTHTIKIEWLGGVNMESFSFTLLKAAVAPEPETTATEGQEITIVESATTTAIPVAPETGDTGIILAVFSVAGSALVLKSKKNKSKK